MWRWIWRRKWRLLLASVATLACGWLIWTEILRAELAAKLQAMRDAGHPVDLADLMEEPVPDEENAAVLYAKAAGMIGEFPYALEAYGDEVEPEELEEAAAWLESKSAVVALLHEAAIRPSCVFGVDWTRGVDAEWRAPMLRSGRFMDLLEAYAEKKAREGMPEEAFRCVETMFRIGGHVPPTCNAWYLRRATNYSYAMGTLRTISSEPSFEPDDAKVRLDSFLSDAADLEPLLTALRGDLVIALDWSREWIDGGSPIPALKRVALYDAAAENPDEYAVWHEFVGWVAGSWIVRPFAVQDGIYLIEEYHCVTNLLETESLPDLEGRVRPKHGFPYVFSTISFAPIEVLARPALDLRAYVAITRAGLDALIYRKRHGRFPDDLTRGPLDPYTGNALLYERREDGTSRIEAARPLPYEGAPVEEWEIVWELK